MPLGTPTPCSLKIQENQWAGAQGGARPSKVADRFESCTRSISMRKYENIDRISICNCSRLRLYWIGWGGDLYRHYRPFNNQRIKGSGSNSLAGNYDSSCNRNYRPTGYQEKRKEVLMHAHKHLKSRKDARLVFSKNQTVSVRCLTDTCKFSATIQNVSSSGIFIKTDQELLIGQEIAISFTFTESGNQVQAAGKVVRITNSGIGLEINIYFKDKSQMYKTRSVARKNQPKVIFLGSSNRSK